MKRGWGRHESLLSCVGVNRRLNHSWAFDRRGGDEELMRQGSPRTHPSLCGHGTVRFRRCHGGRGDRVFWKKPLYMWGHERSPDPTRGSSPTPVKEENSAALTHPTLAQKPLPIRKPPTP